MDLIETRYKVASFTSSENIQLFFFQNRVNVFRRLLATNPNISEMIQLELAKNGCYRVKCFLAKNHSISEKTQLILTRDTDCMVLYCLTENPSISKKVQIILANDTRSNTDIHKGRLLENENLCEEARKILKNETI